MKYAAKHGKYRSNTLSAIRDRRPFNAGNLTAELGGYASYNRLPEIWKAHWGERIEHVTYTVYSYNTPIAWFDDELGWTYPDIHYSATTGGHQSLVRESLRFERYAVSPEHVLSVPLNASRRAAEVFA